MTRRRRDQPERPPEPPVVNGRTPPHDLDAEALVLSACILNRDSLDEIEGVLTPEHFYSEANAKIFEGCLALRTEGKPVDAVSVATWLRDREVIQKCGGVAYVARLTDDTPAVLNVQHHAATVREKWRLRRLIEACQRTAAEGYGDVADAQAFIEAHEARVLDLTRDRAQRNEPRSLGQSLDIFFAKLKTKAPQGLNTGLKDLDDKTSGFRPGQLIIIGARPGMGKTALLDHIELEVGRAGLHVHSASLEMPDEDRAVRKLATVAGVNGKELRNNSLRDLDEWRRVWSATEELKRLPIYCDEQPGQTVEQIRAQARRRAAQAAKLPCPKCGGQKRLAEHGPDGELTDVTCPLCGGAGTARLGLVTVDYAQLGRTRKATDRREQEVAEVSRQLKELAKELGVPVIANAQLNREVEKRANKEPTLADLRESGQFEQDGDIIIFIHRNDYYEPDNPDGIAKLIIAKGRDCGTGWVKVLFDEERCRFRNLLPGDYERADAAE